MMEWKKEIYLVNNGYADLHTLIQVHMKQYAFYLSDISRKPVRVHENDAIFLTRIGALKFLRAKSRNNTKYYNSEIKIEEKKTGRL
jgi:hypothetical protein